MPTFPQLCGSVAAHPSRVGQAVHNATYRKMGIDFSYVAFGVTADPSEIVNAMRTLGIRGLAVTMPYKETIIPHLDHIDPLAKEIGAVNTIVNDNGTLTGHNVDWLGAVDAMEHHQCTIKGKRAFVAGAGGAARAVAFGLKQRGAREITLFNRTATRGKKLAQDLNLQFGGDLSAINTDYDILIHATSAGHTSQPGINVIPDTALQEGKWIFDIVPEPKDTPLLQKATEHNCQTIQGYHMRLHQAAAQIKLYTGQSPPLDFMESQLTALT